MTARMRVERSGGEKSDRERKALGGSYVIYWSRIMLVRGAGSSGGGCRTGALKMNPGVLKILSMTSVFSHINLDFNLICA